MKKKLSIIFLFALLASSCDKDELPTNHSEQASSSKFTASLEGNESRTYIEEGNLLRWTKGDQISLFNGNTLNQQFQFDGETGDNSGTFTKVNASFGTGNDLSTNYAVYPYNSTIKITENGAITSVLPAVQSYAVNSFGLEANTMVAVTQNTDDTFLKFKNVCGYLKLQLYGDDVTVKSIILRSKNNEKLSGKATISYVYGQEPSISMSDDATTNITLDCGNGVKIGTTTETATAFWLVVPPTSFEDGFEVTITDINGNEFTKSTSNAIDIERNIIKPMAAFEFEITSQAIPYNQIWYTSSDGCSIVTPYLTSSLGANIISNVYENGIGIITFDRNLTTIGFQAFAYRNSLKSIKIPNSVTAIEHEAFLNCTSLEKISIPNSVTKIGSYVLENCQSLKDITIERGNTVYDSRDNCNAIIETKTNTLIQGCNNTIIPNSVTTIGTNAFALCRFTNITIPNGVTTILNYAFTWCQQLENISIPKSITTIGEQAFASCSSLGNIQVEKDNPVYDSRDNCNAIIETNTNTLFKGCKNTTIPNNITQIGNYAFSGCTPLTGITIPENVSTVGNYAFSSCETLSMVKVKATTPPTLSNTAFAYCNNNLKIYVPEESFEIYKTAENWKDLNLSPDNQ